ncbi:MAG: helix-turn-helix domain-containing protein [Tannerella sp.]|jgi:excisionase family DNA binding protein|nr:helix-turn-helix domain-containing protein [Tannerella sp.]
MKEISENEWDELKSMVIDIRDKVSVLVSEKQKEFLTPREVCRDLHICRSTYRRHVEAGRLRQVRIGEKGSRVYVRRSDIENLKKDGKI